MSLFATLGQGGDIWSLSGISFASPINDLLDKGEYTIEQLLNEDEFIQEVKSKNDRLLEFLCTGPAIEKLLYYVITPADPEKDRDERRFRYPYMSCEVICCEVPELLTILVENNINGGNPCYFLDKLFTFLELPAGDLDCYLAGYFEKILEMLFRRATRDMMTYFNDQGGGIELFKKFLCHIDNYSIMQIVQRLMLPHLPFSSPSGDNNDSNLYDDNGVLVPEAGGGGAGFELQSNPQQLQCNWSFLPEACDLLLRTMLQLDKQPIAATVASSFEDIPMHISDMLITVLQLSPPETMLIQYLAQRSSITLLLTAATTGTSTGSSSTTGTGSSSATGTGNSNVALAAASVLESLISRLYENNYQQPATAATAVAVTATEEQGQGDVQQFQQAMMMIEDDEGSSNATTVEDKETRDKEDGDKAAEGEAVAGGGGGREEGMGEVAANSDLSPVAMTAAVAVEEIAPAITASTMSSGDRISAICEVLLPFVPAIAKVLQDILDTAYTQLRETEHDALALVEQGEGEEVKEEAEVKAEAKVAASSNPSPSSSHSSHPLLALPCKLRAPRLGHHGLQLIKLVEGLTRIHVAAVDQAFIAAGLYQLCLQLFLTYEFNSVLHLSVQRILVTILETYGPNPSIASSAASNPAIGEGEGETTPSAIVQRLLLSGSGGSGGSGGCLAAGSSDRLAVQVHLLVDCGLLQLLMDRVGLGIPGITGSHGSHSSFAASPKAAFQYIQPLASSPSAASFPFASRHSSIAGHLILIAHAVYTLLLGKDPNNNQNQSNGSGNLQGQQDMMMTAMMMEGQQHIQQQHLLDLDPDFDHDLHGLLSGYNNHDQDEGQERSEDKMRMEEEEDDVRDEDDGFGVFTTSATSSSSIAPAVPPAAATVSKGRYDGVEEGLDEDGVVGEGGNNNTRHRSNDLLAAPLTGTGGGGLQQAHLLGVTRILTGLEEEEVEEGAMGGRGIGGGIIMMPPNMDRFHRAQLLRSYLAPPTTSPATPTPLVPAVVEGKEAEKEIKEVEQPEEPVSSVAVSVSLLKRWDDFIEQRFQKVLEHQILPPAGPSAGGGGVGGGTGNNNDFDQVFFGGGGEGGQGGQGDDFLSSWSTSSGEGGGTGAAAGSTVAAPPPTPPPRTYRTIVTDTTTGHTTGDGMGGEGGGRGGGGTGIGGKQHRRRQRRNHHDDDDDSSSSDEDSDDDDEDDEEDEEEGEEHQQRYLPMDMDGSREAAAAMAGRGPGGELFSADDFFDDLGGGGDGGREGGQEDGGAGMGGGGWADFPDDPAALLAPPSLPAIPPPTSSSNEGGGQGEMEVAAGTGGDAAMMDFADFAAFDDLLAPVSTAVLVAATAAPPPVTVVLPPTPPVFGDEAMAGAKAAMKSVDDEMEDLFGGKTTTNGGL